MWTRWYGVSKKEIALWFTWSIISISRSLWPTNIVLRRVIGLIIDLDHVRVYKRTADLDILRRGVALKSLIHCLIPTTAAMMVQVSARASSGTKWCVLKETVEWKSIVLCWKVMSLLSHHALPITVNIFHIRLWKNNCIAYFSVYLFRPEGKWVSLPQVKYWKYFGKRFCVWVSHWVSDFKELSKLSLYEERVSLHDVYHVLPASFGSYFRYHEFFSTRKYKRS